MSDARATTVSRRWLATTTAALVALVWLCYGACLDNDFVFDDAIFMERDERVHSVGAAARLFHEPLWGFVDAPGRRGVHQYYRPLQQLPLVVSSVWFEQSPRPAHLMSLALHSANAVLVLLLLLTLGTRPGAAAVLTALFAAHPAGSESALWVADVAGLGATLCTLLCVVLHTRHRGDANAARWSAVAIGALTLTGALFKESGVLIPAFMIAYDLLPGRARRPAPSHYAAALAAIAAYFVARVRALGGALPGADEMELGPAALVVNAIALLPSYIRTLFWPFDPNMYHDFYAAAGIGDARFLAGAAVAAIGALAIARTWRRRPVAAFGLIWAAIGAAPFLVVRWPQLNAFAERYLYMPTIGAAIVLGALLPRARPATRSSAGIAMRLATATVAAALMASYVVTARARTADWADEVTIYTKTLTQSSRAELVRNNLALRYLALERPREGIPIQRELLRIDPDFPGGWHNLGLLLLATDDARGAVDAFERSAELEPLNGATLLNLGYAYDLVGRREDAVVAYFRAVAAAPRDARAWYNLAVIAFESRQLANAERAVAQVMSFAPGDADAAALGRRVGAARAVASASTSTGPTADTRRRSAAGRAAAEAGRYRMAAAILNGAAWLDERSPLPHHYLANVYFLQGLHEQALVHQRAALQRAPDNVVYARNLASLEELVGSPPVPPTE